MVDWNACTTPASQPDHHRCNGHANELSPGNPFARRESHTNQSITTYKILTLLSWLLAVITSVYYTVDDPRDGFSIRQRIWDLNDLYRTAFTLNPIISSIYWCVLPLQPPSADDTCGRYPSNG